MTTAGILISIVQNEDLVYYVASKTTRSLLPSVSLHQKVSNTYKSGGDDDFATKKNTHHTDVLARALELDQKVTGKGASRLWCFFLSFFLTLRRCCLSV